MSFRNLLIILIGALIFNGCNHLRIYPNYSEVSLQRRSSVQIYNEQNRFQKQWIMNPQKYKLLQIQKQQIEDYIRSGEDFSELRKEALRNFKLVAGFTGPDVVALIGPPSKIKDKNSESEVWVYKEKDASPKYYWFYDWAKLYFKSGILVDIETKHINIHDPQGY